MQLTIKRIIVLGAVLVAWGEVAPGAAWAQGAALDDDDGLTPGVNATVTSQEPSAQFGFGVRLRQVYILEPILELFFGDVPGSTANFGIGGEFIRRKGNFALTLGIEYDKLAAAEGLWLEKGDHAPMDEPDLIEFQDFGWIGLDINFMWQANLGRMFGIRYGAGLGIALVLGEVLHTDYRCTTSELSLSTCDRSPVLENDRTPDEDIPPVFPIVNMVLGVEFRPIDSIAINIEGGLRSLFPFAGASAAYLF